MGQKTIELAGMAGNLPDNRVADGTMQEIIINLRLSPRMAHGDP